jgi:hypothetical protein
MRLDAVVIRRELGFSLALSVHHLATWGRDTANTDLCPGACGIGPERRAELQVRLCRWQ